MDDDILDVIEWIQYAQEDYNTAEAMASALGNPYSSRQVCFSCQQAAEKILKAYSIAKEGARIKEHDLNVLLKKCESYTFDFNSLKTACTVLNTHIRKSRYPSGKKLTDMDMKDALKYADEILIFTKAKLKEMGYEYVPEQDIT